MNPTRSAPDRQRGPRGLSQCSADIEEKEIREASMRRSVLVALALATATLTAGVAIASRTAQDAPIADNAELQALFQADLEDRKAGPAIDWSIVKPRDDARLKRAKELYASSALKTGADWLHAALILQHSDEPDDFLLAHEMCVAALAEGEKGGRWLVAATEDRFLRSIGRMQRFGTQYEPAEKAGSFRLAPTDPQVTDDLRGALGAPPLAEAKATETRFDQK